MNVKTRAPEKRPHERGAIRAGRPPKTHAGEVDRRILDAARRAFLEKGLDGASVDEIAKLARAGKPTIYARFPDKEALYVAVAMRNVAEVIESEIHLPDGTDVEEQLISLGVTMLRSALTDDHIGVMRLGISEARRFPDLAGSVHRMASERGIAAVTRLLREAARSDKGGALAAFAPNRLATTAQFFIDLVLWPMFRHALFGKKLRTLRAGIEAHVTQSVAFFLAACRA